MSWGGYQLKSGLCLRVFDLHVGLDFLEGSRFGQI